MRSPTRIAVAGISGAWSTERLAGAFTAEGCTAAVVDLGDAVIDVRRRTVRCAALDLGAVDAVVVKKLGPSDDPRTADRVAILEQIELVGVPVFSSSAAIGRAMDRSRMTVALAAAGIPIPDTVIAGSVDEAEAAVAELGAAVVKPLFTSKGRGMLLLDGRGPVRLRLREAHRRGEALYLQRFVAAGGRDIGVAVVGDRAVGAYARVAAQSWLTTTAAGGSYAPHPLDWDLADLATRAARVFGLDYTVVDVALTPAGPVVYEVSAFGGFRGLWEASAVDAAALYARHVLAAIGARAEHARSS